jgi:membrane protease subunit (stomatin/prohibitin family)
METQLRTVVVSAFSDTLGEAKIPALDLLAQYDEIGAAMRARLEPRFGEFGIDVLSFALENITVPEDVQKAMDQRASMGAVGDLRKFAQYQAAQALRDAASNPGGAGNVMGMMLGGQLGGSLGGVLTQDTAAAPMATAAAACPHCHQPTVAEAAFCAACGKPLSSKCVKCGAALAAGTRFCGQCGQAVAAASPVCAKCGAGLPAEARFCAKCGAGAG